MTDATEEPSGVRTAPSEPDLGASEGNERAGLQPPSAMSPGGSDARSSDAGSPLIDASASPGDSAPPVSCAAAESLGPSDGCYVAVAALLSWSDARLSCRARGEGWDLAAVGDAATNEFLAGLIASEAWLGGSDADEEGTWRWLIDDTVFWSGSGAAGNAVSGAYENWNSDEPNGGGNSDCVRLLPMVGSWADLECGMLRGSVCERPAP